MKTRLGEAVFSVAGRPYDWADVVLAARLRGDWADLAGEVRLGLACASRADEEDEDADPDAVEAAANEWRYARDLLTAEETEAWLARWQLTTEDWMEAMRRAVLRRGWADEADDILAEHAVDDAEVDEAIWAELVVSGRHARLAEALAARAAVYERAKELESATFEQEVAGDARVLLEAGDDDLAGVGLPALTPEACRGKLEALAHLEAGFRRLAAQVLTPRAIADQLHAHHLDWIRIDCRYLAFPAIEMAREARLSVREDGLDLAEAAEAAGTEIKEARLYLDQLEPALRDAFLGAGKGELLGPLPLGSEFAVFLILDKTLASADDPETRRRAEEAAWASVLGREVDARVTWHTRL